jgi:hypothetical protein
MTTNDTVAVPFQARWLGDEALMPATPPRLESRGYNPLKLAAPKSL